MVFVGSTKLILNLISTLTDGVCELEVFRTIVGFEWSVYDCWWINTTEIMRR